MTINRIELVKGYNEMFGTQYESYAKLLEGAYAKHQAAHKIADVLGVDKDTVRRDMHRFGIKLNQRGGACKTMQAIFKLGLTGKQLERISRRQLATFLGVTEMTVWTVGKEYGLRHLCIKGLSRKLKRKIERENQKMIERIAAEKGIELPVIKHPKKYPTIEERQRWAA